MSDDDELNSEGLVDLENMTPVQLHARRWRSMRKSEDQTAEREEYIKRTGDEFKETCDAVEYQIATYVKRYVNDTVVRPIIIVGAMASAYYFATEPWKLISILVVYAVYAVIIPILNSREKKRQRKRIVERRKRWAEPTAKEREMDLFFGGEDRAKEADKNHDWFRRHLSIDEMRFRNQYGEEP
jgi:hypothetical protein